MLFFSFTYFIKKRQNNMKNTQKIYLVFFFFFFTLQGIKFQHSLKNKEKKINVIPFLKHFCKTRFKNSYKEEKRGKKKLLK